MAAFAALLKAYERDIEPLVTKAGTLPTTLQLIANYPSLGFITGGIKNAGARGSLNHKSNLTIGAN
jgi:hypothetical protein